MVHAAVLFSDDLLGPWCTPVAAYRRCPQHYAHFCLGQGMAYAGFMSAAESGIGSVATTGIYSIWDIESMGDLGYAASKQYNELIQMHSKPKI